MFVPIRPEGPGMPEKNEWRDAKDHHDEIIVQRPYGIDLRAYFKSGDFKIVGGVAANFGGYTAYKPEGQEFGRADMPFTAGVTVNPQYAFGTLNVGVVGEFTYHAAQKYVADPYYMYNTAVYIQKRIGTGSLWAAVTVEGVALDDSDELNPQAIIPWKQGIIWTVPVALRFSL
jgi:hypothetical protein